jgi:protein O-GlcNAc transferase
MESTFDAVIAKAVAALKASDLLATEVLLNQAHLIAPEDILVPYLRAQVRIRQQKQDEAIALLKQVVTRQPLFEQGWKDVFALSKSANDVAQYARYHQEWFEANPTGERALLAARASKTAKQKPQALKNYQFALASDPQSVPILLEMSQFLYESHASREARGYLETARGLAPEHPEVLRTLANVYQTLGYWDQAKETFDRAVQITPSLENNIEALVCSPIIARDLEQLTTIHANAMRTMSDLHAQVLPTKPSQIKIKGLFYLSYNALDNRALKEQLAALCRKQIPALQYQPANLSTLPVAGRRIRVGFISTYFHHHTIGKLFHGIISSLDKSVFEVCVFAILPENDFMAEKIRAAADFYAVINNDFVAARELIAKQALDILNYTDLGMDNFTYLLAFSRLAPVQCVYWGHPETTGIDTIDYYISSTLIEPEGAQAQYSEKLILLPQLPIVYEPPQMQPECTHADVLALKNEHQTLYVCPQSLFKMHPEFDFILGTILRKDPNGRIVLIDGFYNEWTQLLRARFERVIPDVASRIRFVLRLSESDFLHLLCMADVVLDSFYFGGGNSTFEALTLGCPIVTWPGPFMRGRVTHGCYQMMGIDDLVAKTPDEYIEIAYRVANDKTYQASLRNQLKASAPKLMDGTSAIRSLEAFFKEVVRE